MSRVPAKGVISKEELLARELGHVVLKFKLKAERLEGWKAGTGQTSCTTLMWLDKFNSH